MNGLTSSQLSLGCFGELELDVQMLPYERKTRRPREVSNTACVGYKEGTVVLAGAARGQV